MSSSVDSENFKMYVSSEDVPDSSDDFQETKTDKGVTGPIHHGNYFVDDSDNSSDNSSDESSEELSPDFSDKIVKGKNSYKNPSDEFSESPVRKHSSNKKFHSQNYDSHSPDILKIPNESTFDPHFPKRNRSSKISGQTVKLIYGFEYALIIIILNFYSFWAFKWSDIGNQMKTILQTQNFGYIAAMAVGALFWAVAYFAIIGSGIYYRKKHIPYRRYLILYLLISAAHVVYHLIRWPIFAALIISSANFPNSSGSFEFSESLEIKDSRILMTFWFDFIALLCVAFFLSFGYGCKSDWDKCGC